MVEGCVTDLPLGREEAGSLQWLGHLEHDHHPDAVSCRLKLSLAAAPCPEMLAVLPWDIVQQVRGRRDPLIYLVPGMFYVVVRELRIFSRVVLPWWWTEKEWAYLRRGVYAE